MEDIGEVITCAKYSPKNPSTFVYASSAGSLHLCDERDKSSFVRGSTTIFTDQSTETTQMTPFTEIFMIITDFEFSPDDNYIASRDYTSIKTWDKRNPNTPLSNVPLIEISKITPILSNLYENDIVFEKFHLAWLNNSTEIITGFYGNSFSVVNPHTGTKQSFSINTQNDTISNLPAHEITLGRAIEEKCFYVKVSTTGVAYMSTNSNVVAIDFEPN